jgi:aromatic ring hydroxylase
LYSSFFAGFAGSPGFYARGGQQFADNLLRFAAKAADEDLYVSYVIVHPTVDRAKPAHQQSAGVRQPVKSSPNSVTSPPEFRSSKA